MSVMQILLLLLYYGQEGGGCSGGDSYDWRDNSDTNDNINRIVHNKNEDGDDCNDGVD